MNNNDFKLLSEAYTSVQQKTIEEAGFLSQMAARGHAAKEALKQGVKNVAHVASGKGGDIQSEKGQRKTLPGWSKVYRQEKQVKAAATLANDIIKDIKALGLVPAGYVLTPEHTKYWEEAINTYVDFINNKKGRKKYPEEENPEYVAGAVPKEKVTA